MIEVPVRAVSKWPFLLGDALLIGVAALIAWQIRAGRIPVSPAYAGILVAAVAAGAWLLCRPFLQDHEVAARAAEQSNLASTLNQIHQLEAVGQQITGASTILTATNQSLSRVEMTALDLAKQLAFERAELGKTLQNMNDQERQALHLEISKLRRGEQESVHVIIHLLDHTYALQQAGARSGQPALALQLGNFRTACLESVRRLGVVSLEASPGESFDPQRHQAHDEKPVEPGTLIAGTFACGYSFQGELVRPIIVVTEAAAALMAGLSPVAGVAPTSPEPTAPPAPSGPEPFWRG